jgi:putative transposase
MRNVRRHDPAGRPVFITQVSRDRLPLLVGVESLLLGIVDELRGQLGMRVYAHMILPDHLHLIVHGTGSFGEFMRSLKLRANRRAQRGPLWQNRFYDHVLRDETDLRRHLDYVHFNPVKHGLRATPEDHPFSSFNRYRERGWYLPGWGHSAPDNVADMQLE